MAENPKKAKPEIVGATLIIGFDGEWVTEADEALPHLIPRIRVLSYQFACLCGGRAWVGIVYTRAGARIRFPERSEEEIAGFPERMQLADLLAVAISEGIKHRHLTRWPSQVVAAAHWTRADLSAMADYAAIKRQFDGVQKTYVTIEKAYQAAVNVGGHLRRFRVRLADTMVLVPGTQKSLAALGDLYQFPKIDIGSSPAGESYIGHMDQLLADNPQLYEKYAIRDAEISARHVREVWRFANDVLGLGLPAPPITLGSMAVANLIKTWSRQGVCPNMVLDGDTTKVRRYDGHRRCYVTRQERVHSRRYKLNEELATECFHGGRNECFAYGPTADGPYFEYDLISASAVAMASIAMPHWDRMRDSDDVAEFQPGGLGVARVGFRFPEGTRFPSLPVVAPDAYGLIYPLAGEAYATATEIAVARRQGAAIDVLDGIIVPWRDDVRRPFAMVIAELQRRRNEHPKGSLPNEMFKQMGNSIYGKLGQGLSGANAFDPRTEEHVTIDPCAVTNAYLASYITGLIRALISELIAWIPNHRTVISVTTDGFVTNAEIGEIDVAGPVATLLAAVKAQLLGDPVLLETKYRVELLPWRTRGIATLKYGAGSKPKLARGGMREPGHMSIEAANEWFARAMLLRQPGDEWASDDPLPFPFAHINNADHVFRETRRKVNFEYDMKRRPINAQPRYVVVPGDPDVIVQHLAFDTDPWASVEDFIQQRETFERCRYS